MAKTTLTPVTILSGTTNLLQDKHALSNAEGRVPSGTPMSLHLTVKPVTIPVVGRTVDLSQWVADAINSAYHAGQFVSGGQPMALWDGATVPATADPNTHTVHIHWKTGVLWSGILVAFIAALTITDVLDPLLAVAAIVVIEMVTGWALVKWIVQEALHVIPPILQTPIAGVPVDIWILALGGAVVLGLILHKH